LAGDPLPEVWSPPSAAGASVEPAVEAIAPACVPIATGAPLGSAGGADFETLFAELAPYVLRVLPRMGVAAPDVEDVAQDVFFTVHRALPGFEGRSSVRTWVYGICIRVAGNYRQRAYRRHEQLMAAPDEDAEYVDARTPARDLEARRSLAALDAALSRLSDVQRAVFVLHEVEQLPITEIATALECPKFTVYARLYAARRSVRAELRKTAEIRDE
jgi:RNA polymerase sigma-70 factor (ECF subfamily)